MEGCWALWAVWGGRVAAGTSGGIYRLGVGCCGVLGSRGDELLGVGGMWGRSGTQKQSQGCLGVKLGLWLCILARW